MSDILDYLNLPNWMDESIKVLYRELRLLSHIGHSPNSMENHLSDEHYDDFNKIRVNVLSHSRIYLR